MEEMPDPKIRARWQADLHAECQSGRFRDGRFVEHSDEPGAMDGHERIGTRIW